MEETIICNYKFFEYDVIKQLGNGVSADVFMYRHRSSGLEIAGKHAAYSSRSLREVEVLKQLNNQQFIVNYLGEYVKTIGKRKCHIIFLECADTNLSCYIARAEGVKDEIMFRSIAAQLVEGLRAIHQAGFIHGDLSHFNVLVKGSVFKYCDFETAIDASCDRPNKPKGAIGTKLTSAPEVLVKSTFDQSADIWSLGCLLYFIAECQFPFSGATENNREMILIRIAHSLGFPEHLKPLYFSKIGYHGNLNEKVEQLFPHLEETIGLLNRDLILNCIKIDPKKRAEASQLYYHETFTKEFNFSCIPHFMENDDEKKRELEEIPTFEASLC